MQEAAQLLSGEDVPTQLLEALLLKVKISNCVVVNATPYDAWLENVCLRWSDSHEKMKLHHLSVSLQPHLVDYVQKKLALQLLKAIAEIIQGQNPDMQSFGAPYSSNGDCFQ